MSGYQCEYKKRTGSKPDGCAIVFKSCRLSLLSSNPIEFLRPGDTLLDRDNVGLVLLLQPHDAASSSGRPTSICVANTHLLYNPRRGDIKLAQLAVLLAEISRFSRPPNGSSSPVVLCGDFNSTPLSPLYRFLTTGRLNYSGLKIGSVSVSQRQRQIDTPIARVTGKFSCVCRFPVRKTAPEVSVSCRVRSGLTVWESTISVSTGRNRRRRRPAAA